MRLKCDRTSLVDKLNTLARGVSTRSALPVLSGILLQAKEGCLDLYSTDMEISIKASLTTEVERDGEAVVPARLFTDVVKNLSAEEVVIELKDGRSVEVASGKARFSLNSWVASDFPQMSAFDTSSGFTVGRDPFVETLTKVGRAASRDETRPILTGVLVTIAGGVLKMVATDSYRLSVKETPLGGSGGEQEVEAIVPVKALSEVARLAATMGEGDIEVAVSENQALFKVADAHGDVWIASRLIDGQFPNYRQLVPESFDHTISLGKEEFLAAARRISLLAQKNAPLRLGFAPGRLTLRAVTQDVGQAEEELDIEFSGEEFEIGFNAAFLVDGTDSVDGEQVTLKFINPLRPGLVTGQDESFLYLIMPIRLSS
jgi:DNA polymerase III subunit beta